MTVLHRLSLLVVSQKVSTITKMCAAYATIANGGEYNKPTLYSKVVDHDGNVLLDGTGESHTVIKDSTAYLLTNAMEDVVNSGTGTACQLPNMPVAGKTGTTTSNKDLWFCGFTPYYTCAVWEDMTITKNVIMTQVSVSDSGKVS